MATTGGSNSNATADKLPDTFAGWLRLLLTPGVAVGVTAFLWAEIGDLEKKMEIKFDSLDGRITTLDAKLDRRADNLFSRLNGTNGRIDKILDTQVEFVSALTKVQSEVAYVKARVDGIATKMQISLTDPAGEKRQDPANNVVQDPQKKKTDMVPAHDEKQESDYDWAKEEVPGIFDPPKMGE